MHINGYSTSIHKSKTKIKSLRVGYNGTLYSELSLRTKRRAQNANAVSAFEGM